MRVLFKTAKMPASSTSDDARHDGVAWFELVLHEGPPDDTTWEGRGNTIAYWRTQFARLKDPHPCRIDPSGIEGVAPVVIPDEVLKDLPEDARISFVWNFVGKPLADTLAS